MSQPRMFSAAEACANTATGMMVSFGLGMAVYPMFGFTPSATQNLAITSIFTVASVIRSYAWRRAFNRLHH